VRTNGIHTKEGDHPREEGLEIVEVERETIDDFLDREWKPVDESVFGRYDPAMWDVQRYTLAAYQDERIVGAALFKIEAGLGKLSQIITAADRRGQGIGETLLARFEEICRGQGCHKASLKTYWKSEAQRFYHKHGYVVEGVLRRDLHGLDMCHMCKFL
jgi:GNAT superfamily N-acetyltransferase